MKLILILAVLLTGCATHQGTDGRTYYWFAPLPANNNGYAAMMPSARASYYQVNGSSYQVISFK